MTGVPRPPGGAPWLAAIAIVALVTSYTLVGVVRAHAIRANVMDHPNERSSHREPTPRGGGLGAVIALLLATTVGAASLDRLSWRFGVVAAALTALAAVGWLDDR